MLTQRKIFAVGDIHGCFQKLKTLMSRLPVDRDEDLLVFIGDYINRGKQSREVIDYLLQVRSEFRNTVFLMGNHEHALLEYAATRDLDYLQIIRMMGIESTLESYFDSPVNSLRDLAFLPPGHRDFMEGLLPYYEENGYLFTHAGIIPGEDHGESPLDRLLSVRKVFLESGHALDFVVVFGHTPFTTPLVTGDKIGIDTGAVYGNFLTAVELPRLRFYHA